MPSNWNADAQPKTRSGTTYIDTNKGEKKIRIWQPGKGEWKLTKLGKRYYRSNPSECLISIPVRYDILRQRDNAEVFYKGYSDDSGPDEIDYVLGRDHVPA